MTEINTNRAGLTLGILFGACHTLWIAAVGLGAGKLFLDLLHSIHFVSNPYTVTGFDPVTAVAGIIAAFASGYVIGWISAWVWNQVGASL
ncbi:MAG: hypothetical protein SVU32_04810 [Candidatus Nanohaloarchaea archaeon]|nr:hypothetical protein [Candidatus Nanohaloarchaea archaeon]